MAPPLASVPWRARGDTRLVGAIAPSLAICQPLSTYFAPLFLPVVCSQHLPRQKE